DGLLDSAPDTVTISTLNSLPVADAGPDGSGTVGATVVLDGTGSHDADGDALTSQWSLTTRPGGSLAVLVGDTTAQPSLTLDRAGTYVAQLIVNDGIANSAPDTVTLSTINSKPVADAGAPQSAFVSSVITLDGSQSFDVDGDLLTFAWALVSVPPGSTAALSDATSLRPFFTIDTPGTYIAQLIANDGTVDSDPATVTISTVNSQPFAYPGPDQTVFAGTLVVLDGSGSFDIDGDPLTYAWALTSKPEGSLAELTDPTGVQTAFFADLPGLYAVQLIVNDGALNSDPMTGVIAVFVDPCTGSNAVICTPSDSCHTSTCDSWSGTCFESPKPDETACDDGDGCTQTDTCHWGTGVGSHPIGCTAQAQCHAAG